MIVVADATPLIALAKIKHLGILAELFGRVVIPQSVYDEVVTKALNRAGASEVAKAVFFDIRSATDQSKVTYLLTNLDAGEQNRYRSQFRWFLKKVEEALDQANMRIVNIEGHPFDPGMAATPLNIEEFGTKDNLMVDQMIEPIIMGKEGLIRTGTVILRKVEL